MTGNISVFASYAGINQLLIPRPPVRTVLTASGCRYRCKLTKVALLTYKEYVPFYGEENQIIHHTS
jgi:hypothetical protein